MKARPAQSCYAWCLLLIAAGCAETDGLDRLTLAGNVSFDGQPVQSGAILFLPTGSTAGPSARGVIEQGQYVIAANHGPIPGDYLVKVTIAPPVATDSRPTKPGLNDDIPPVSTPHEVVVEKTLEAGMDELSLALTVSESEPDQRTDRRK